MLVVFECRCGWTVPGQWLAVVGSASQLGAWDVSRAVKLQTSASSFPVWSSGDVWLSEPAGRGGPQGAPDAPVEFKFLVGDLEGSAVIWEQLPCNRRLLQRGFSSGVRYRASFGEEAHEEIPLAPSSPAPAKTQQQQQQHEATWMGRSRESFSSSLKRLASGVDLSPQSVSGGGGGPSSLCAAPEGPPSPSCTQLLGPGGPPAASSPSGTSRALKALAEGNASAPSWGAKLELVKRTVAAAGDGISLARASPEQLVAAIDALCYAGIYTEFVRQGAVSCQEDGRHFRPNRHANLSRDVSVHLELLLQAVGSRGDDLASALRLVIRSIPPALPSFADAFRAAQPLTRIRNIAHRDDIPMDLKNEIKHTIQNKLHRCAGPEDLETTRNLLQRIQADRSRYSVGFVSELETFYGELCAFFNQADLCQRLRELRAGESPRTAEAIDRYLDAKARSDAPGASPTKLLLTLGLATDLRIVLTLQLRDAGQVPEGEMQHTQNKRMAELQLEDAAFVLLSRLVNSFEEQETGFRWTDAIEALYLGARNIEASGVRAEECRAIQRELQSHARGDLEDDEALLLLKATVDRTRRLCQDITDVLLAVFAHRVELLGGLLGVDPLYRAVYAEGRIRSNVVFQLSKVSHVLLRSLRQHLHQQPYDVLVAGCFVGSVAVFETLSAAASALLLNTSQRTSNCSKANTSEDAPYKPLLVCARTASGDEEVAGIDCGGTCAAGVVIGHDIPILSHLGVRARQQRLPFVACQDSTAFDFFCALDGQWVEVAAFPESFSCRTLEAADAATAVEEQRKARLWQKRSSEDEEVVVAPFARSGSFAFGSLVQAARYVESSSQPPQLLPSERIKLASCGAKAATCARLEAAADAALQKDEEPVFRAPKCLCLPFGSMEWALHAEGHHEAFHALLKELDAADFDAEELEKLCSRMQQLILTLPLPNGVHQTVKLFFGPKARLCLRSSANVEDLAGMSAAGLYESVCNVPVCDVTAIQSAVCTVWASLFSRRAVLARKVANIPQREACMAVLFQELLVPELSFILHTGGIDRHPASSDSDFTEASTQDTQPQTPEVYAELAPGLGEILASARMRGSAYRMLVDRETGAYKLLSACSFSNVIMPVIPRSKSYMTLRDNGSVAPATPTLEPEKLLRVKVYDQTADPFASRELRAQAAKQIAAVAVALGEPQDVEGVFTKAGLFIVQARPQA
ncbi:phosphoglucan, water dikinase, chloroplastic [Cyclospora cayetanensis]|uniref:Phosphoglucan, water dikinase, chloroplastic n=1 Tax=Cyclospora cayetanensis TaxID=88456 RepID=A0A6P5WEM9_9EIME|nr:phosphoglucan, water dikinase, chloroplastic [Cyclospora cayetanensis]